MDDVNAIGSKQTTKNMVITVNNHGELKRALNLIAQLVERGYKVDMPTNEALLERENNHGFPARIFASAEVETPNVSAIVCLFGEPLDNRAPLVNSKPLFIDGSQPIQIQQALYAAFGDHYKGDTYTITVTTAVKTGDSRSLLYVYKSATNILEGNKELSFTSVSGNKITFNKRYIVSYVIEKVIQE